MNEAVAGPNLTGSVAEIYGEAAEPEVREPAVEPSSTPAHEPDEPAPTSTTPQFPTTEQITASVREGLRQSAPPAEPKQYSPEELDKLFNVWQPTNELMERIRNGGEDGLRAFVELRDGLSKQFGTLLQYQLELARRELVSQMDPALKYVAEAAAKADRDDFFGQNEDLKDHELLTQTVFNALKAEGYQAPDKATAFKTLADRTRALIPTSSSNGSGHAPSGAARTTNRSTGNRPASLSSGSQAGGGGGSAPQAPFAGAEVFL